MRLERPPWVPLPTTSGEFQTVGEHFVPRRLTEQVYTYFEDDSDDVLLRVVVDVSISADGLSCDRLVLEPGTHALTRALLAELDPLWFAADALGAYGFAGGFTPRGTLAGTPDDVGATLALSSLKRRTAVTPARLDEVAAAYERGGAAAVQRSCFVSKSQAHRLIDRARRSGKLPPKGSGR